MTIQERQAIADEVALRLLAKTYSELAQLADDESRADAFLKEQGIDIHHAPFVSLMVGELRWLRKKLCVEITVVGDSINRREQPGCVYFEKYSSGKLVVYGLRQ